MRIFILITIFILSPTLWWNTLHAEKIDLVELQKQEKERREKTKKSTICVTNETLDTFKAINKNYTATFIKPDKTNNWGNPYPNVPVQDEKERIKPPAPREKKQEKERKDSQVITFHNEPYNNSTSGYFSTPRTRAVTYHINEAKRVIGQIGGEIAKNERRLEQLRQQKVMYPPVQRAQEKLYQDRIDNLRDGIKAQHDKIKALEAELREEYEIRNQPYPGIDPIRDVSGPGNNHTGPAGQNQTHINNGNTNNSGNTSKSSSRVGRNNGSVPGGSSSHLSPGGSKSNFDVKRHQNNAKINPPQPQFRIKRKRK